VRTRGTAAVAAAGAALVALVLTGRASLLVRPWFAPILLATGVLVAVVTLRHRIELSRRAIVLLLAPVAVGISLSPSIVGQVSQGAADPATLTERLGDPGSSPRTGVAVRLGAETQVRCIGWCGCRPPAQRRRSPARSTSRSDCAT